MKLERKLQRIASVGVFMACAVVAFELTGITIGFMGCSKPPTNMEKVQEKPIPFETHTLQVGGPWLYEMQYKGHSYLFFAATSKGGFLHAEHCQCKQPQK